MNEFKIEFLAECKFDSDNAYYWYELQKKGLGERFLTEVWQKLNIISKSPETYGAKSKKGYREAKIKDFPYTIVYKIYLKQRIILVCSIHHQSMHPNKKYRK